jgi:serine/threonine-protein kinase
MDPARVLDDRYELIELVGSGGMAEVWRARDRRLERDVAVKLLPGAASKDASKRRRIEREARALAATSHPNIVSVYDYGEETGGSDDVLPFIVMELVDGPDLHRYLSERGPFQIDAAVDTMRGVLGAVELAHKSGIVHGDLKPANVFMGTHGPKVGDFGVARILEQETGATTVAATPTFAAPEVLKGERPTVSSDVYSAACLTFELLTGRAPYTGSNAWEITQKHIEAPVPSVRSFRSDVPAEMDKAIQRAMDKNPRRRYSTAAEFAEALGAGAVVMAAPSATVPVAAGAPVDPTATQVITGRRRPDAARAALFGPFAGWGNRARGRIPKTPRSRAVLAALLCLVLLVAFLVTRDPGMEPVAVPNMTGKKVSDAAAALRLKGFKVDDVAYRPVASGEPNRVLETIPAAKEMVEPGAEVHIIASALVRTPAPVVTPRTPSGAGKGGGGGKRKHKGD